VAPGDAVDVSIRSELVRLARAGEAVAEGLSLGGTYDEAVYLGLTTSHRVRLADGSEMVSRVLADGDDAPPAAGEPVRLHWHADAARLHVS
jgi:ABC-type Fe3+/spermidine/putrescine transport system ATPase subunit